MTERNAIKVGSIFQITMMLIYTVLLIQYGWKTTFMSPWMWPSHVGELLFLYCLFVLYIQKRGRPGRLITEGPFKYTRHPMYTGLAMMDLAFWIPQLASTDTLFFVLQATFCICLLMAAWFQEKETVARFGKDAEDYYQKTPRFVLLYPFAH